MTSGDVTPICRDTGIQRGTLPNGVRVEVDWWLLSDDVERPIGVVYLGSLEALLAEGCLTPAMLEARSAYRPGDTRGLGDGRGVRFNLHRAATKAEPERWRLRLSVHLDRAFGFPGVRELFPKHLAAYVAPPRARLRLVVDNTREVQP